MAMDARSINRLLVTHAKEAARLEGRQADEFLALLKATREQLLGSLYGQYGGASTALDWFRVRRIALETEAMIRSLEGKATRSFIAGQQTAAEMAVEHLQSELRAFAGSFQEPAFKIGLNAAKVWADPSQGLLADHFASSVQTYGSQLLNDIRRRLFVGVRSATPTREIIEEVAAQSGPLGRIGASKAETLVRTEVSQVFGTAQQGAIDESNRIVPGGMGKMWIHVGSYPCPTCMPLHGTTRPADGTWTVFKGKRYERTISGPPAHPRCVPPGTLIATPTGEVRIEQLRVGDTVTGGLTGLPRRVTDTHRNQSSGGVVVVSAGGRDLWLTDTHPVLTARGWVYAVELQAGDKLFRHFGKARIGATDRLPGPTDDRPAVVAHVGVSRFVGAALLRGVVPVPGIDLDVHHVVDEGKVEVVLADGVLHDGRHPGAAERIQERQFDGGWPNRLRLVFGALDKDSERLALAAHGSMSGLDATCPLCGVGHRIPQHLRRGESAPRNPVLAHAVVDRGAAASEAIGNRVDVQVLDPVHVTQLFVVESKATRRQSSGLHSAMDGAVAASEAPRYFVDRESFGEVKSDDFRDIDFESAHDVNMVRLPLVSMVAERVERRQFFGTTHNLSVESDESYVAEGVVVKNCVCRVAPMKRNWKSGLKRLGYLDEQDPADPASVDPEKV